MAPLIQSCLFPDSLVTYCPRAGNVSNWSLAGTHYVPQLAEEFVVYVWRGRERERERERTQPRISYVSEYSLGIQC